MKRLDRRNYGYSPDLAHFFPHQTQRIRANKPRVSRCVTEKGSYVSENMQTIVIFDVFRFLSDSDSRRWL